MEDCLGGHSTLATGGGAHQLESLLSDTPHKGVEHQRKRLVSFKPGLSSRRSGSPSNGFDELKRWTIHD